MSDHLTHLIRAQLRHDLDRDMASVFTGTVTNAVTSANDRALSIDDLLAAVRWLPPAPPSTTIIFTATALKETDERLFPVSKNRSRRIHKKLVKRHGSEFRRVPAMWRVGDTVYAHPSFRSQLEAQTKETNRDSHPGTGNSFYLGAPHRFGFSP